MSMTVTTNAMRPASTEKQCFYCRRPIGDEHGSDCVLVRRKVKVRMTTEYEIEVPAHWKKDNVEFHRNESSWCANNALDELKAISCKGGCLCSTIEYEYLEDASDPYLFEG